MLNAVTKGALAMDLLSLEWSSGNSRVSDAILARRRYCPAMNRAVRTDNGHAKYLNITNDTAGKTKKQSLVLDDGTADILAV